ncbi:MAG TPA: feruloyl-CoA synthase [Burkholderiales bacterium]
MDRAAAMTKADLAPPPLLPVDLDVTRLPNGGMILRSRVPLQTYPRCLGEKLVHWAAAAPQHPYLAERAASGAWQHVTYEQAHARVRGIAQALLDRDLSPARPIAVLSANSIDMGLLTLAAMHVGVPIAPISVAYALQSTDYGKLKQIFELLTPGLVMVGDGIRFAPAIDAVGRHGAELVVSANPKDGVPSTAFAALADTAPGAEVDRAFARVGPDTIAKFLFTSGSTGMPKAVINTQRMLCSNQQSWAQTYPFLAERPPVLVDWLPWNHTFGGNNNFGNVLWHGGTLYIDEGKPMPGLIERTVANLRDVSPTIYFNVPRGYDMLLPYLERDADLRDNFFRRLDLLCFAGAALPSHLWQRLDAVAVAARGKRVLIVSAWGATETAPGVTAVYFETDRPSTIGLPTPGFELKLVPNGDKLELCVRGPNVTPGYWKRDDLTRAAFDADGFYRIGDAGRLTDPNDPAKGVEFDGRIAEDFKLTSGTWVHVGDLRVKAIAAGAPVIQDVAVVGPNRADIGLLVFPNEAACRRLCDDLPDTTPLADLISDARVSDCVARALQALAAQATGASNRPTRALIMEEPASIDANEITDKGYVNQRAVLTRRAALIERLYADPPDPAVIGLGKRARHAARE